MNVPIDDVLGPRGESGDEDGTMLGLFQCNDEVRGFEIARVTARGGARVPVRRNHDPARSLSIVREIGPGLT